MRRAGGRAAGPKRAPGRSREVGQRGALACGALPEWHTHAVQVQIIAARRWQGAHSLRNQGPPTHEAQHAPVRRQRPSPGPAPATVLFSWLAAPGTGAEGPPARHAGPPCSHRRSEGLGGSSALPADPVCRHDLQQRSGVQPLACHASRRPIPRLLLHLRPALQQQQQPTIWRSVRRGGRWPGGRDLGAAVRGGGGRRRKTSCDAILGFVCRAPTCGRAAPAVRHSGRPHFWRCGSQQRSRHGEPGARHTTAAGTQRRGSSPAVAAAAAACSSAASRAVCTAVVECQHALLPAFSGMCTPCLTPATSTTFCAGKNKRLSKGKKGTKKKV